MGTTGQGRAHQFRTDPERVARFPRVLELYRQRVTYQAIATEFGYANKGNAYRLVQDALAAERGTPDPEAVALEEAKLDQREDILTDKLLDADEKNDVDAIVRLDLELNRVAERRARLKGHDAPTRVRVATLTDEQLAEEIAREQEALGDHADASDDDIPDGHGQ